MATPTTRFVTASNKSSHLTGFRCAGSVPLLFPQLAPIGARVADSLIMTSMPTKAAMVELLTRRTSYGQDTSKLYQREESCKRWRAEHPAIPEDKAEAKERLQRFQAAVGSMEHLKLDGTVERHVQSLVDKFIHCGVCGDGRSRAALKQRLERVRAAAASRRSMQLVHKPQFVILDCRDYLTYVRDEEPGTMTKMVTKPRTAPYEVGRARGHACNTRTKQPEASAVCSPSPLTRDPFRCTHHDHRAQALRVWRQQHQVHPVRGQRHAGRRAGGVDRRGRRWRVWDCTSARMCTPGRT